MTGTVAVRAWTQAAVRDSTGVACPVELRAKLILYSPGAADVRALRRQSGRKTDSETVGPRYPLAGYLTAARRQLLRCDQSLQVGRCNAR